MNTLVEQDQKLISSRQIAEAAAKNHHDVMADIRKMKKII